MRTSGEGRDGAEAGTVCASPVWTMKLYRPVRFSFSEEKATAAAAVLLKEAGGRMKYLRLIKLLYFAERESLRQNGRPICGDDYVSMQHGPVLSRVLNLAKESATESKTWRRHIHLDADYRVKLVRDPGVGALSEAEIEILMRVSRRFKDKTQWQIRDLTHRLPEWQDPGQSCFPIFVDEILSAVGKKSGEIDAIFQRAEEQKHFRRLFRS
jgi:uncharacterized phage-associated protein